ncbi:MAG TPA: adenosylcobinamide-GDP ribazoletransferase, partial [Dermatophilaceae bacterium]
IGPSGVAVVVLVLMVDASALASLLTTGSGVLLVALSVLTSRHLLAWGCSTSVPSARKEGLGATVSGTVQPAVVGLGFALLLGLSALMTQWSGPRWWAGPAVVGAAALGGIAVIHRATQRFGGITGDVLGALIEVSLAVALTTSALLLSMIA